MKIFLTILFFTFFAGQLYGQETIEGNVLNAENEPLVGANVFWLDTQTGSVTDSTGNFQIKSPEHFPAKLIVSYVGYRPDTLIVDIADGEISIQLEESLFLGGVEVRAYQSSTFVSRQAAPVQVVSAAELQRAACCDLSGCFETNTSVQPSVTNIITNSKELRMLGLSGVYNYQMIDNMPLLNGLAYTYGLSSWPGTSIQEIHISKGTNSVVQGYEPITGEINFQVWDPAKAEPFLVNLFVNHHLEHQANVQGAMEKGNWKGFAGFHTARPGLKTDKDNDGFLDAPLTERYAVFTKHIWQKNSIKWKIGARYVNENRLGGQIDFDEELHKGTTEFYGQRMQYQQAELYSSLDFEQNENSLFRVRFAGQYHHQDSYFGLTTYDAVQSMGFAELRHEFTWQRNHQTRYGVQLRHLDIQENIAFTENVFDKTYDGRYDLVETVPGLFAEQQFNWLHDRVGLITGLRLDHHNRFGYQLTPRFLLRYAVLPDLDIRLIAGSGWRTAKFFAENSVLLASHRNIPTHVNELLPERAFNYGGQIVYHWEQTAWAGYLNAEYFYTDFSRMHAPDLDTPNEVNIPISGVKANSGSFMLESSVAYENLVEVKAGYVYQTSSRESSEGNRSFDFLPEHKFLGVVSYRPFDGRLGIDANVHIYGKQRIPLLQDENGLSSSQESFASPYGILNFQITWFRDKLEIYSGVENVTDFRQKKPIAGYETPFSGTFDPSFVWGPVRGREIYAGLRWKPFTQ